MLFAICLFTLMAIRMGELLISRENEKWLLSHDAVEYGHDHYAMFAMLHGLFFVSLFLEYTYLSPPYANVFLIYAYLLLMMLKLSVISTLGPYWNTKIYRIPHSTPVRKGLYKFLRHPNYMIVAAEFIIFPMIFYLYYTTIIFSLLNLLLLRVRIKEEDAVWSLC